jgi:transposase InsO family protein
MDKKIEYVHKLYTDIRSPVSFSSPQKIYKHIRASGNHSGITLKVIKQALNGLDSYNLYKTNSKKFATPRVRVQAQFQQVEIDLMDVTKTAGYNNGVKFIFIAVDVLSKLAFAYPLKSKKSDEIYIATETMLCKWPKIESLSSDRGSEFKSSVFQQLIKKNGVRHFFVGGKGKGAIVESFIRYLRARIARFKTEKNTQSFLPVLDNIIDNYNNTCHSSTKFKPSEINEYNQYAVFENLYNDFPKTQKTKKQKIQYNYHYKIGDAVRISLDKSVL